MKEIEAQKGQDELTRILTKGKPSEVITEEIGLGLQLQKELPLPKSISQNVFSLKNPLTIIPEESEHHADFILKKFQSMQAGN